MAWMRVKRRTLGRALGGGAHVARQQLQVQLQVLLQRRRLGSVGRALQQLLLLLLLLLLLTR